jgi:hypothetical protein
MPQIVITQGQAYVKGDGLRCMAKRSDGTGRVCDKLVVKKNPAGEIAGAFQCPDRRCRQPIQVETRR